MPSNTPHPDSTTVPDDATVVPVAEGHEHGYYGAVTDPTPNEAYTVAGVAGGTAHVGDTPSKDAETRQRSNHAAKRSES